MTCHVFSAYLMSVILIWRGFFAQEHHSKLRNRYEVFRTPGKENEYLLLKTEKVIEKIPDIETVKDLLGTEDLSNITFVPDAVLETAYTRDEPIPSLKVYDKWDIDGWHVWMIKKIKILSPPTYVREGALVPGLINGAIIKLPFWSNTTYLCAWKATGREILMYGAIDMKNFSLVEPLSMFFTYYWNGAGYQQQEARVLPMSNNRFFITTTGRFNVHSPFIELYGIATMDTESKQFTFSDPVWINYGRETHQKNYVPFLYNDTVHLIPSINPLVVMTIDHVDEEMNGIPNIIHKGETIKLPWKDEYGDFIRGGTAAMPVRGVYLSFFHVRASTLVGAIAVYWMGAVTFCPHPPFHIHSMSQHPIILNETWYTPSPDRHWVNKYNTYVVYPIGLAIDDDDEHLTISMGIQDKDIFVQRLHIDELMDTLEIVSHCKSSHEHEQHEHQHSYQQNRKHTRRQRQ
jgi:hypothetical protein